MNGSDESGSEDRQPENARDDEDDHPEDDHPEDIHGTEDATLGGYFRKHDRPPAFEGVDGNPYTVSVEVEKQPDLREPWAGFLVFPRWARTGAGIVSHVETPLHWRGRTREEVERKAGETPLLEVKRLLDAAIRRKTEGSSDEG